MFLGQLVSKEVKDWFNWNRGSKSRTVGMMVTSQRSNITSCQQHNDLSNNEAEQESTDASQHRRFVIGNVSSKEEDFMKTDEEADERMRVVQGRRLSVVCFV